MGNVKDLIWISVGVDPRTVEGDAEVALAMVREALYREQEERRGAIVIPTLPERPSPRQRSLHRAAESCARMYQMGGARAPRTLLVRERAILDRHLDEALGEEALGC